jgi:Cu/Ag efflux protein CusF
MECHTLLCALFPHPSWRGTALSRRAGKRESRRESRPRGGKPLVCNRTARVHGCVGPAATAPVQKLPMVSGTVEKVDVAVGKITIEHGSIPNLKLVSMTMVFRAQDPAMLKNVKPRDNIRFTTDRVNGQITVTKIQKAR